MSALYAMRYVGRADAGAGAIYIGRGTIVGVDVGGGRYRGTYAESSGRIKGTATLSLPNGGSLVTGKTAPPGTEIPLTIDWPLDFFSGKPQSIDVAGQPVQVSFEKIGDIP